RSAVKYSNQRAWLLRPRRERPRGRGTCKRDERAPLHSISEQCRRHGKRKRLRSLKVEHQCLRKKWSVAHEPANSGELAAVIEGGHSVPRGQRNDLFALRDQERVATHQQ